VSNQAKTSARAVGELVRLLTARLGATGYGRFARFASVLLAGIFVASVITLRVSDGSKAATTGLQTSAARWSMWLVGLAVAFAASRGRTTADRRDGFELLADMRGLGGGTLLLARAVAGFWLSLRFMAIPALFVGVASIAASGSVRVAVDRTLVLCAVAVFSLAVSLVLPPLAAVIESIAPKRGGSVLISVLLVTAALAELANDPAFSIFGLLGAALRGALHLFGVARFG